MVIDMKIVESQCRLCKLSTLKSKITNIAAALTRMKTRKAYDSLGPSNKRTLRIANNVKAIQDQVKEVYSAMKSLESISESSPESKA